MRCVVTGGYGFIGSHVADALVARGDSVTVLDDLSSGTTDNLNGQARLVNGSILDTAAVDNAVRGVDCVFHLAAWARVPRSIEDPVGTHQINVVGTLNVLEAVRRHEVPRLVYVSSSSVYGKQATHLMQEAMAPDPLSPYGLQKLIGEQYCTLYTRMYGITIASLRYFNVYGPRQTSEGPIHWWLPDFASSGTPASRSLSTATACRRGRTHTLMTLCGQPCQPASQTSPPTLTPS